MTTGMYLRDSYPGESLMLNEIERVVAWNREACRIQDMIPVCWLRREEIERQQRRPA